MLKEVENPDAVKAVGTPGTTSGGADALKSDAAQQPRWTPIEHFADRDRSHYRGRSTW